MPALFADMLVHRTGRRPDATQCWSFMDHFREEGVGDRWISMPEWFRLNGFYTSGTGKM